MTIETKLVNGKYPLPGKYPLRVVNVMQENDKTIMLVEPEEVKPGLIIDRFLNLNENDFVIVSDCLIEDENFLKGKSFAFTGTPYKRQEIKNALTINYKGEIRGAVTEKVDCLIVGSEPNKIKINRALSLGIPMISAEFLYEWLNSKREEAIKKQIFGNFNTTHFSEAMTKVADQLKRDLDRMAIRSATMRKAAEVANIEGMAIIKVTPESCEVIKSSDIVMMVRRDSEPEASQAANPVGLHQSTGQRPIMAELNRFSSDAHTTPTIDASYEKLISDFLDSEDMQTILKQMAFLDVPHKNILIEFKKQLKEASSKIGKDGVFVQALGRGIRPNNKNDDIIIRFCGNSAEQYSESGKEYKRADLRFIQESNVPFNTPSDGSYKKNLFHSKSDNSETLSYVFELKNDGSISVKDCGKEYHFPVWLSQMTIAYCGKSKQAIDQRFYQRYDLASKAISIYSKSDSEYQNMLNDFNKLIDFVQRSM